MADAPVTPGPTVSQPPDATMLLAGGPVPAPNMGGNQPPDLGTAPSPNVQPAPQAGVTTTQGPTYDPSAAPSVSGDAEMQAAAVHHGRIGAAIDAVSKALGGSRAMHVVQMPDGSYVAKEMDTTPGERWSRIARAALSGASAGFAGGRGYGGGAGAFSAGAQTGLAMPQQMQDQTMQKAQDLEAQREKGIQFKKNMALLDIQAAQGNLALMQSPIRFEQESAEHAMKMQNMVSQAHGQFLAHYANSQDLASHVQANQKLLDDHMGKGGGTLMQIPQYDKDGKQTGVDVYGIPPDTLNQYIDSDVQVPYETISPDGKSIQTEIRTWHKGQALWKDVISDQKLQQAQNNKTRLDFNELQNKRTTAEAAKTKAETEAKISDSIISRNFAEAAKARNDTDEWKLPTNGYLDPTTNRPIEVNRKGETRLAPMPEGASGMVSQKAKDDFDKNYKAPAVKAEESYQRLKAIVDNAAAGRANPQGDIDALVMAMQGAVGLAPSGGGGRGGMAMPMLKERMASRGLVADKTNLIEKLISGQRLTQDQRNDILESYNGFRKDTWRVAGHMAVSSGMKPDSIVPPNVAGRDKILSEFMATPQPGQQQTNLPKAMEDTTKYPIRPSANGGREQWDGAKYVPVQ